MGIGLLIFLAWLTNIAFVFLVMVLVVLCPWKWLKPQKLIDKQWKRIVIVGMFFIPFSCLFILIFFAIGTIIEETVKFGNWMVGEITK